MWGLGAARLVSTPCRQRLRAGLGSGLPLQVSPNLGSSASPVSRRALKFPQVRCLCHSATPAWLVVYSCLSQNSQGKFTHQFQCLEVLVNFKSLSSTRDHCMWRGWIANNNSRGYNLGDVGLRPHARGSIANRTSSNTMGHAATVLVQSKTVITRPPPISPPLHQSPGAATQVHSSNPSQGPD
jgi:hypothetical protein